MPLSTSGTYEFQTIALELLIREAYENIGILGNDIVAQQLDAGRRSVNFLLLEWSSKGVNLWTRTLDYLALIPNQSGYTLPNYVRDIRQANVRTSTRLLNGTPASSEGVAASAFDNNTETACTQVTANGNISYSYGNNNITVNFIGVQSNVTRQYSLVVEVTNTPNDANSWRLLFTLPLQSYTEGITKWADIPVPRSSVAYRIREMGGAVLDIREIFFNNNTLDTTISLISREEYIDYPNKKLTGRPSTFYLDRQIKPVLYLWPAPTTFYNCLQYTYQRMMDDAAMYNNTIEIPARFYEALVAGLSARLAIKFAPDRLSYLQPRYEAVFSAVTIEDSERTSITITPDYSRGGVL